MGTPSAVYATERKDTLDEAIKLWFKLVAEEDLTYTPLAPRAAK